VTTASRWRWQALWPDDGSRAGLNSRNAYVVQSSHLDAFQFLAQTDCGKSRDTGDWKESQLPVLLGLSAISRLPGTGLGCQRLFRYPPVLRIADFAADSRPGMAYSPRSSTASYFPTEVGAQEHAASNCGITTYPFTMMRLGAINRVARCGKAFKVPQGQEPSILHGS